MKGAPDVLIGRCSHYVAENGEIIPLNATMKATFEKHKDTYSSEGKRCLVLARKVIKGNNMTRQPESTEFETMVTKEARDGLTLVGLVAIVDPLRSDIPHVVKTLRGAHIRIAMVSPS